MSRLLHVALLLGLISVPLLAHDISGNWEFTVDTAAGSGSPSFIFKQDGEKLTGTYSGLFGKADLAGTVPRATRSTSSSTSPTPAKAE